MSRKYGEIDIIIGGSPRENGRGGLDWPTRFRALIMRLRRRLDETLHSCPPGEYREIAIDQWIVCRRAVDEYRRAAGPQYGPLACTLIELFELELQRNSTRAKPGAARPRQPGKRARIRALFDQKTAAHPKATRAVITSEISREINVPR